jgi:hypothetical protein
VIALTLIFRRGPAREGKSSQPAAIHHVRAASALVAFTDALGVSLAVLVGRGPDPDNSGDPPARPDVAG